MHFGPCTYEGCQWNNDLYPAANFAPTDLDADQWVAVAKSWGATEICLTARHSDGFALWRTNRTSYGIKESPFRGGQGDVMREFVDACRRGGVLPCVYFGVSTDLDQAVHVKNDTEAHINNLGMLEELLTLYGPLSRLWWDGFATACGSSSNGTCRTSRNGAPSYSCSRPNEIMAPDCSAWFDFVELVRRVSPGTLMVPGPDGNLVNPEEPGSTYPLFHAVQPPYAVPDPAANTTQVNGCYWQGNPGLDDPNAAFAVAESDFTIYYPPHTSWFWTGGPWMSASGLWQQYLLKAGLGAAFILNIPPDKTGQINASMAATVAELGAALSATYLSPVASLPGGGAPGTLPACRNTSLIVELAPAGAAFDQVVLTEGLEARGQIVTGFTLEVERAAAPNVWAPLPGDRAAGSTVGARVTALTGAAVTGASRLRFNCTRSADPDDATPVTISLFSAFLSKPPVGP